MESLEEKSLKDYPVPIFIEETTKILNQMKKSVCKIFSADGSKGTGFFCKIPLSNKKTIPVMITNYHVIKEGTEIEIQTFSNKSTQKINLENKFKYANPKHDIFIIELTETKEDKDIEYMELDDNSIKGNNLNYIGSSIYIIHYPDILGGNKVAVSYGILKQKFPDKEYSFKHFCSTEYGSSGSPILNLSNNKIIGIHTGRGDKRKEYNIGSFLSNAINEFINKYNKKKLVKEIDMKKLEINDENFFNNLFKNSLIKDIIAIKDKNLDIAYKFVLNQKNYKINYDNWEIGWHGTLYKNLHSIIKYGLQIQGTKLEDGKIAPETIYEHPESVRGIKNWANAIFASDKLYFAMNYSENKFRCILGVKIEPGNYTTHDPYIGGYLKCCSAEEADFDHMENIYRIPSPENIIVNTIIFINYEFLDNMFNYHNIRYSYDKYINFENILKT